MTRKLIRNNWHMNQQHQPVYQQLHFEDAFGSGRWIVVEFCKLTKFYWISYDVVSILLDVKIQLNALFDGQIARWIHSLQQHTQGWFAICPFAFHLDSLSRQFCMRCNFLIHHFGLHRFIMFLVCCIEWFYSNLLVRVIESLSLLCAASMSICFLLLFCTFPNWEYYHCVR